MSTHAVFSPSGAKKWMTCTGSVAMEANEPDDTSEYADEGTAAHWLGSTCLTEGKRAEAYLGRIIHVINGVYWPGGNAPKPPLLKGHKRNIEREFAVTADMAEHVNTYIDNIRKFSVLPGAEVMVEERVPISHITGEKDAEGTSDTVIYVPGEVDELQVHDLKFGYGVKVYAKENPQGMMYLLGALRKFEPLFGTPKRFRFIVHQPRLDHLDEWDCSFEELQAFAQEAEAAATAGRMAMEFADNWIGKSNTYLTPGDHCRKSFCKARATCPALAVMMAEGAGADFEVLADIGKKPAGEREKAIGALIPTDLRALGEKAAVIDTMLDWAKQVRARIEAALFEHNNSAEAQQALGCKLVQGKKGNRQWGDETAVLEVMKKMRLKSDEIYDYSVKTPPAMQKVLKDHPKRWNALAPFVTQKDGQPSVTDLADKRPALEIKPAIDEFAATDGSDLA